MLTWVSSSAKRQLYLLQKWPLCIHLCRNPRAAEPCGCCWWDLSTGLAQGKVPLASAGPFCGLRCKWELGFYVGADLPSYVQKTLPGKSDVSHFKEKGFPHQSRSDFSTGKAQNSLGTKCSLEESLRAINFPPYQQTEILAKSFLLGAHIYPHRVRPVLYNSSLQNWNTIFDGQSWVRIRKFSWHISCIQTKVFIQEILPLRQIEWDFKIICITNGLQWSWMNVFSENSPSAFLRTVFVTS